EDASVQCWGENDQGQIGAPGLGFSSVPVTVNGIANAVSVSSGFQHSCAVLSDGTVRCWGDNSFGQLGNGSTANSATPVQAAGIVAPRAMALGIGHTCALMPDTSVLCWGENGLGALGDGTATSSLTPVRMHGTGMTWTSSNPGVATVSAAGLVTAVSRGTATITAADPFGNIGSTTLTVRQLFTLTAARQGDGAGTVTSTPAGINCGSTCSASFVSDSTVTMTAAAGTDSVVNGAPRRDFGSRAPRTPS